MRSLPAPLVALVTLLALASGLVVIPVATASAPAAPATSAPGPPLTTPRAQLARAVHCTERANRRNPRQTVVLVHGTGSTPGESWRWSYSRP